MPTFRAALCSLLVTLALHGSAEAGSFAPGSGPELTPEEIAKLDAAGSFVTIDGVKKYLLGDQLYGGDELSTRAFQGKKWTGGTIAFSYSAGVSNPNWRRNFTNACARWSNVVPNVRCTQRTNERNQVEIRTHVTPRCVSFSETTGMKGGKQIVSIYHDPRFNGPVGSCNIGTHWDRIDVIAHEIGHVFGFVHEQSRWDRDLYVTVLAMNLRNPEIDSYQFRVIPTTKSTAYTPYDFHSIMHYHDTAFAKPGKKSLVPAECYVGKKTTIGSQGAVTESDALELQHHYGLPIWDMLRQQRDPSCGSVRVNPAERRHYCVDLKENCGPGANDRLHSARKTYGTSWCPGAFAPACAGASGAHRSCCPVGGKEPFDVSHDRGSRSCTGRRVHNSKWRCGCAYYMLNARCPSSSFGIDLEKVGEYAKSNDSNLRTLGKFMSTLVSLSDEGALDPAVFDRLEKVLIVDYGQAFYFVALDKARRRIEKLRDRGQVSSDRPLSRSQFVEIVEASMNEARRS